MENFIIKQPVFCQVGPVIQNVNEILEYELSKYFHGLLVNFQLIF
jgi:hypothetical protein